MKLRQFKAEEARADEKGKIALKAQMDSLKQEMNKEFRRLKREEKQQKTLLHSQKKRFERT